MLTENPIADAHYRAIIYAGRYNITCPGIDRHHQFIRLLRRSQDCPCEGKTIFTLEAFGCHWQGSIRKLQGGEAALTPHYSYDGETVNGVGKIGAIQVLLRNVPVPEVTLAVSGLGYFSGPRCLWGTPVGKLSKVFALAAAIKEAVAPVVESPTLRIPHITLAGGVDLWWEEQDPMGQLQSEAHCPPWLANGFTLYHSVDGVHNCIEHYGGDTCQALAPQPFMR